MTGRLAIVVLACLAAAPVDAATYYVSKSGNNGNSCASAQNTTQSRQKLTIAAGLRCLGAPGDTLIIHEGTYVEAIHETSFGASGRSWTTFTTVTGAPGERVTLQPNGYGNAVRFQDSSIHHVLLRDLILDGSRAGGGAGAAVFYCGAGSHDLHTQNVEIMNGDGNGILCYGSYHEFRDTRVHTNGLFAGYRISIGAYMTTDNSKIIGGEYYDNECFGIRFWDSDKSQRAENNIVSGARIYRNGYGIGLSGKSDCGSDGGGITLADVGAIVQNNLIYENYYGIQLFDFKASSNILIYNNTITANTIIGLYIPPGASGTDYANNIVYDNKKGNIVDRGTASRSRTNLVTNPGFIGAAAHDYSLQPGSAARDKGTTLPAVDMDCAGTARPQGSAYDLGAYEYAPAAPARGAKSP